MSRLRSVPDSRAELMIGIVFSPLASWALVIVVLGVIVAVGYWHLDRREKLDRMDDQWRNRQQRQR